MFSKIKPYLYIFLGNSAGAALQFIILPVLTRLYSAEDFALYSIVISWSLVAFLFSTLKYDTAILQTKTVREVSDLNTVCVFGSLLISIVVTVLFHFEVLVIESDSTSFGFAALIACSFAMYTLVELICKNLVWHSKYKQTGAVRALCTVFTSALQLGFAYIIVSGESLIFSRVLALFAVVVIGFYWLDRSSEFNVFSFDLKSIKATLKRFFNFPKFDFPSGLTNYASANLPYIFVPLYFGLVPELGIYALVERVFQAPANLLRNAIKDAFHKEAASRFENGLFPVKYMLGTVSIIAALIMPFSVLLIFFGEELFAFIFSEEWRDAGTLAAFGAFYFVLFIARSPIQSSLQIIERQSIYLVFEIVDVIAKVVMTSILVVIGTSPLVWLKWFFIVSTISYALNMIVSIYLIFRFSNIGQNGNACIAGDYDRIK